MQIARILRRRWLRRSHLFGRSPRRRRVDRNQNGTKQISVWMSSRNVLYLDFAGNLIGTSRGDGSTGDATFGLVVKK